MSYQEQAVMFGGDDENLVGVASLPNVPHGAELPLTRTGVVIVVGGPQYRAGSHRQFVLLARALAAAGTPVLRFDYRGMGDSTGELHTFENVNEDIAAAISALQIAAPNVQNVALWGLCDGASAALLYCRATNDARVKGLCLLNPWVRSEASLATTQVKHYYAQRLRQQEFWVKLLSGKVAASAVGGLMRSVKTAFAGVTAQTVGGHSPPYQTRMAQAWMQFKGPMLLILSGNDYTAKEFLEYVGSNPMWAGALGSPSLERHDLPKADHTFSALSARRLAEDQTIGWIQLLREMSHDH
ncbi:MAG: hydrolase 1, exosortase A system-associated [Rhodoferax sp.]